MELRYCENCGEVIRIETDDPISLTEQFFCESCKHDTGKAGVDEHADEPDPLTLPTTKDLDLFSQRTIVERKKKDRSKGPDLTSALPSQGRAPSTRLRLVNPSAAAADSAPVEKHDTPAPAPETHQEPDGSLDWMDEGPGSSGKQSSFRGSKTGSKAPSSRASRLMFRCLHCRLPLAVRPVKKTSRLSCPRCKEVLYLTAAGRTLKNSPTHFAREGVDPETAVERRAGSIVVRKESESARKHVSSLRLKSSDGEGNETPDAASLAPPLNADQDCSLVSVNPKSDWRPKQTSAFEEHRASNNPDKTMFISEEDTGSLRSLADGELLENSRQPEAAAPQRARRQKQPKTAAAKRGRPVQLPTAQELRRRPVRKVAGSQAPDDRVQYGPVIVRTLLLLVALAIPLTPAVVTTRSAHAQGLNAEAAPVQSGALDGLGRLARRGLEKLLKLEPTSDH